MALWFVLAAALAAAPVWLLIRGVQQGVWNGRGVNVARSERPFAFWFGIAMYAAIALIILSAPLYLMTR